MKRVGITGGIGCGKTTVLAEFRRLGVPCFVSDEVASGFYCLPDFLDEVRQAFGTSVFLPDGSLSKPALANRVFSDPAALQVLNALVHPKVLECFGDFCRLHADAPYLLFESAILYECGIAQRMDAVVCVYLDKEERIRRLLLRDRTSRQHVEARMAAQWPAEEVMARADYVVLNYEGNPRARQVAYIDHQLKL